MAFREFMGALSSARRFMAFVVLLAFSALSIFAFAPSVFAADSNVTFEGGAEKFVFYPGSAWSETDLFHEFNDLMPGDTITETITVKNESAGDDYDYVNIYLRAVPHDEQSNPLTESVEASGETVATMSDFLSKLSLTVKNNGETIFEAAPSKLDGLKSNVLLGSFRQDEGTTLTVTLKVPSSLGSRYMNRVGEVDWVFTAEAMKDGEPVVIPEKAPDTGFLGTGVDGVVVGGIAAAVVVALLGVLTARKRA